MISYSEAVDYLFNQRPAFERQGASGYKPGLDTTMALDAIYGHPHEHYHIIHVAGSNGKGSVASLLAAILQSQGYTVGLYTSPHFVDFNERIRVNGEPIPHDRVAEFVDNFISSKASLDPSFFELTTILAFKYFEERKVDFAVVEVGLGGRLDSTNIVTPILSIITSISLDHTEFLGNTIASIASEKAGIIKPNVPVVVGKVDDSARQVIAQKARLNGSKALFVSDIYNNVSFENKDGYLTVETAEFGNIECQLIGDYQRQNIITALAAIGELRRGGVIIDNDSVKDGFKNVCCLTAFRGRWTTLAQSPLVVCDSAHNIDGITYAVKQLSAMPCDILHIVVGFMADKDLARILKLLPKQATYYFTQASTPRALKAHKLKEMAAEVGLNGSSFCRIKDAYAAALDSAKTTDVVYVGGSMYVLAELFEFIDKTKA